MWHTKEISSILSELATTERGLTASEALMYLKNNGENALPEAKKVTIFQIFLKQFEGAIIYILLIAALIVFLMGDFADGFIILAVLILNAVIGTIQEGKSQDTLSALRNFVTTNATVFRDGVEVIVPDKELVVGDVITLKEGDKVPADARIISVSTLKVDESALTGESEPVLKNPEVISRAETAVADQKNMLFKATYVVGGTAKAVVVAIGIQTVIGRISEKIKTVDTEVPLKANIRKLSKFIIIGVLAISVGIFVLGITYGNSVREMFSTVVAIAVSAIPEGLPLVVTLILATGVARMSKRNALVKRLQAVEALGQAKILAVDKTGTITLNQMMVSKLYVDDSFYDVSGNGYEPKGSVLREGSEIEHMNHPDILMLGKISAFTSLAATAFSKAEERWVRISGDPTEAALLVFSQKMGFSKEALEKENPQIFEIPFSSALKYHATINSLEDGPVFSISGAPEIILSHSKHFLRNGKHVEMTKEDRLRFESTLLEMSREGLRVLGCALKANVSNVIDTHALPNLCFVGFVGISDAIRPETRQAVEDAQKAGIKVVMITGDFEETARALGKKAHIYKDGDEVITGVELDTMSNDQLIPKLLKATVFARVSPDHKLKIIELYRSQGIVIAMTGDGVNDALSLAAADLGIAMGKVGTEVAKEAADIVLLDDNFGSVIAAVEEGRNIYHTIKKVIFYLFSTSLGTIIVIITSILLGYPLPILAGQIIWLNFVTDGFLVAALALEPKEEGALRGRFKQDIRAFIDGPMIRRMCLVSGMMAFGTLYLFKDYVGGDYAKATTIALTVLVVFQWFNAWNCRSEMKSVFTMNIFENKFLVWATGIVVGLQMFALYLPFMQNILHTVPLSFGEWIVVIGISLSIILVDETRKAILRWRGKGAVVAREPRRV